MINCSEGNRESTSLSIGVEVTSADTETSGKAEAGTGLAKMSRRACLAEGAWKQNAC